MFVLWFCCCLFRIIFIYKWDRIKVLRFIFNFAVFYEVILDFKFFRWMKKALCSYSKCERTNGHYTIALHLGFPNDDICLRNIEWVQTIWVQKYAIAQWEYCIMEILLQFAVKIYRWVTALKFLVTWCFQCWIIHSIGCVIQNA